MGFWGRSRGGSSASHQSRLGAEGGAGQELAAPLRGPHSFLSLPVDGPHPNARPLDNLRHYSRLAYHSEPYETSLPDFAACRSLTGHPGIDHHLCNLSSAPADRQMRRPASNGVVPPAEASQHAPKLWKVNGPVTWVTLSVVQ